MMNMEWLNSLSSILAGIAMIIGIPACAIWLYKSSKNKEDTKKPKAFLIACIVATVVLHGMGNATWVAPDDEINTEDTEKDMVADKDESGSEDTQKDTSTEEESESEDIIVTYAEEIRFKDIPWGTSYTEVDNMLGEFDLLPFADAIYQTYSIDHIIFGEERGIDFEYDDINIIALANNGNVDVAGYMTKEVSLYFAYFPVNGVLTKTLADSSLYGAQYKFYAEDLDRMSSNLMSKLSSIYGESSKTLEEIDGLLTYNYTYWYGANDTAVVLKTRGSVRGTEGEITISYVWLKGDEMLQKASDTIKEEVRQREEEEKRKEDALYNNGSTEGL